MKLKKNIEYEIIDILDKRFIIIPETLMFFESNPTIEEIMYDYNNLDQKELLEKYPKEKRGEVKSVLKQINTIVEDIDLYNANKINSEKISINSMEINPAHSCNLRCKYCYAQDGSHDKIGFMSEETARKAVDFLIENSNDSEKLYIAFIGGEPLLNINTIEFILDYSTKEAEKRDKQLVFSTTVNGTLLTSEIMNLLDDYDVKSMISLDSIDQVTNDYLRPMANGEGSYQKIMENGWESMLSRSKKSAIRSTITPANIKFYQTAKGFYESGFYHVHVEEVKSEKEDFLFSDEDKRILKEEYINLAQYLLQKIVNGFDLSSKPLLDQFSNIHNRTPKYFYCGAFKNSVGISANGGIYPCDGLMWESYKLGTLNQGIDSNRLNYLKSKYINNEKCTRCWARNLCGRGCIMEHIEAVNKKKIMDCSLKLFKFKLQLYLYSEIAKKRPEFLGKFKNRRVYK